MKANKIDYPSVLVVNGEPFNKHSATGFTLNNLFMGWPGDKIAQIYTAAIEPDRGICTRSWRLDLQDLVLPRALWSPLAKHFGSIAHKRELLQKEGLPWKQKDTRGLLAGISRRIRVESSACLDLVHYRLDRSLLHWIDEFKPELIYSLLGSLRILELTQTLADRYRIPLVPHFMDDWQKNPYRDAWVSQFLKPIVTRKLANTLKRSSARMVISEAMAEEYERRYRMSFSSFMNCVEEVRIIRRQKCEPQNNQLLMVILGNLNHGRLELLEDLAHAILDLRKSQIHIKLIICAHSQFQQLAYERPILQRVASFINVPADAELIEFLSKADILLHLESFRAIEARYFRYSISAKIPIYLAAGKAILVYGPGLNATAKYARMAGWGHVVDLRNAQLLRNTLIKLATSITARESLGQAARAAALKNHSATVQRERFRQRLTEAAASAISPEL